jgi:hypothetical protein
MQRTRYIVIDTLGSCFGVYINKWTVFFIDLLTWCGQSRALKALLYWSCVHFIGRRFWWLCKEFIPPQLWDDMSLLGRSFPSFVVFQDSHSSLCVIHFTQLVRGLRHKIVLYCHPMAGPVTFFHYPRFVLWCSWVVSLLLMLVLPSCSSLSPSGCMLFHFQSLAGFHHFNDIAKKKVSFGYN